MPRLVIRDQGGQRALDVTHDTITFGRGNECTVQIRDTMASRVHFKIERAGAAWNLVDLESRNGTKVNGVHINQHQLRHGDEVQVGEVAVRFEADGGGVGAPAVPPPPAAVAPPSSSNVGRPTRRVAPRRRGGGNDMLIFGAIGGVVLIAAVLILAGNTGGGGGDLDAQIAKLKRAKGYYDDAEYAKAGVLAEEIPARHPKLYEQAQTLLGKIEKAQNASRQADLDKRADRALTTIQNQARAGKLKNEALIAAYQGLIRGFPGSAAADTAKAEVKRLGSSGGSGNGGQTATLEGLVKALIAKQEYENAIKRVQAFSKANPGDMTAVQRIREIKQMADAAYADIKRRATIALAAGDNEEARKLYVVVKKHFGNPWAGLADDELGKIN